MIVKAIELCEYTIRICKNEKVFPKSDRWLITSRITMKAEEIMEHAREANDIRVDSFEDYMSRHGHQIAAHGCCESLLSLIEISYRVIGLEGSRVEYWTKLIVELEDLIQRWIRSDRDRFPEYAKCESDTSRLTVYADKIESMFAAYMENDNKFKNDMLALMKIVVLDSSKAPDSVSA